MPEGRAEEFNAFPEVSRSHSILYNKTRKSTFCPEFQPISARIPTPSPAAYRGLKGVYFQSYGPPGGQERGRHFGGFSNAACRAGIGGSRRYGPGDLHIQARYGRILSMVKGAKGVFPIALPILKREKSSGEIKHLPDRSLQIRNFVLDDIPHDLIMHPEGGVNENVPHACNLSPGNTGMPGLERFGNEFDGLADHHEVPDHPILHRMNAS